MKIKFFKMVLDIRFYKNDPESELRKMCLETWVNKGKVPAIKLWRQVRLDRGQTNTLKEAVDYINSIEYLVDFLK